MEDGRQQPTEVGPVEEARGSQEPQQLHVVFPGKVPFDIGDETTDATHFTVPEKCALRAAWKRLSAHMTSLPNETYIDFFMNNEDYIKSFRTTDGKFDARSFQKHPNNVYTLFDRLITDGLQSISHFNVILMNLAAAHRSAGIEAHEISLYCETVRKHLMKHIGERVTPTLIVAFDKLFGIIVEMAAERRASSLM